MSKFEQRNNSGALFKNKNKKSDDHPSYTGNCIVNGKEMQIAAWVKEGKAGKFFSIAFSEPYEKREEAPKNTGRVVDLDDQIPF